MCNCQAKNCSCQPQPLVLDKEFKLEVGKTYLTAQNKKVKIVSDEWGSLPNKYCYIGIFLGEAMYQNYAQNGTTNYTESPNRLIAEYKEPEYRWFVWDLRYNKMVGPYTKKVDRLDDMHPQYRINLVDYSIEKV